MTLQIKTGDYVIINNALGKAFLAKCLAASSDGKKYKGRAETPNRDDEPVFTFGKNETLANLGSSPSAGSVYGVKVAPLRETFEHPFFGTINVHHTLNDDTRKAVKKVIHETALKMKAKHMPLLPLTMELRTQVGKMLGMYKYRPKAEFDILAVHLDDDLTDVDYRIAHEFAHGVWYRTFSPKMKLSWIELFHSSVAVNNYSDSDLKSLLDGIISSGDVRSFLKENPDDTQILRAIFRHIKQTHALERTHFEMAMMLEHDVSVYWPSVIELSEKSVLLTDYAKKSPEELFAEAFSLKIIGKKLPNKVDSLLEKCLSRLVK